MAETGDDSVDPRQARERPRFSWAAFAAGLCAAAVLAVAAALYAIYSGAVDVAASDGHTPLAEWALSTTMHNSVDARAGQAPAPPQRLTAAQISAGARHFAQTCATCHGGPGLHAAHWAEDMTPPPPDLTHAASQWSDQELFWIIENGVKMTAMPAFGGHHGEKEIWQLVAFLNALPETDAEDMRRLTEN